MRKRILVILTVSCICLMTDFAAPAGSQDRTPGQAIQGATDPYEVTLYAGKDYTYPIGTWKLAPGMRMLKVPTLDKVPRSILVGSSVSVILFTGWNFSSKFYILLHADSYENGILHNPAYQFFPLQKFPNSSPLIMFWEPKPLYNNVPPSYSLIIHRKDIRDWLGVALVRGDLVDHLQDDSYKFYPLPERANERAILYPKIPYAPGPYRLTLWPGATYGYSSGGGHPTLDDIEVTVNGASGNTFKFPDPNDKDHKDTYELDKYGITQPSSMKIEYKGPFTEAAYVYAAHAVAPTAPNVAKVDKQIPQGYPPGTEKKVVIPGKVAPATTMNISGQWKNNFGWIYNITQQQDVFQWTIVNSTEKGTGTIKGYDLSVSWQGPQGSGSAQGKITEVDATGKATKILWSNGIQFTR